MTTFYHAAIPNTPGIYRITCTVNEKIYIGSAINLRKRWREHCKHLNQNTHHNPKLQSAWNKHGSSSFVFEVIELVLLPDLLIAREQHWFDTLQPFGDNGFNIAIIAGSPYGIKRTLQTREKLRIVNLGSKRSKEARRNMAKAQEGRKHKRETIEKIRLSRIGKTWNAEDKAKASIKHTGKPGTFSGRNHSPEAIEKMNKAHSEEMKNIIAIAPDGTEYAVQGIRKFCKEHQLDHSAIIRVAQGKQKNHKGWQAHYV